MTIENHAKVTARHLDRKAYLYVRWATRRQGSASTESTQRTEALHQQAVALGWPNDRIVIIVTDVGKSGASTVNREGFRELASEIRMGHAGIVLAQDTFRFSRNLTDWHRLVEICALSKTLLLDEEGIYDPAHFIDRLLLGLDGPMVGAQPPRQVRTEEMP